jgi:hypothetical protein
MALMTCAGADVLRARIHAPRKGAWWSELYLDTSTAPSGSATIAASSGLSIKGTIVQAGVFLDSAHVRVIAGAAGLGKPSTPQAYQNASLSDPLNSLVSDAGETLGAVDASILNVQLADWSVVGLPVGREIERLCGAASAALGSEVVFRFTNDGKLWLGVETWPSSSLPTSADVMEQFPDEGRYVIGAETPALMPGVKLSNIGANVLGVDHWITASEVRTWAWT